MGILPEQFEKAIDMPAFEKMKAIRDAERAVVKREEQQDHDLSVAGNDEAAGRRGTGTTENRTREELAKREEKERQNRTETQMLLNALRAEAAELDFQINVADDFLDDLRNGIAPELTADGRIADGDREKIIRDYEERTGVTVDRTDVDALEVAVEEQKEIMLARQREVDAGLKNLQNDADSGSPENIEQQAVLFEEAIELKADLASVDATPVVSELDFFGDGMMSAASAIGPSPIQASEPLSDTFARAKDNQQAEINLTPDVQPAVAPAVSVMDR